MWLNEQLILWNHVHIKLLDIRHITMMQDEVVSSYRLPASGFIYAVRGKAILQLDGNKYIANRFHILHGGKGSCLDIYPLEEDFTYYLILYKAVLPLSTRKDIMTMIDKHSPFHIQYGFSPNAPITLLLKVQSMYKEWEENGELGRFQVKIIFYQFVYELLLQIHNGGINTLKNDLVTQAKRYLEEHYAESITMDMLAELFDSSSRNLTRLFKTQTGSSPIDYLIGIRMDKAKVMLVQSDATLKEITESIGYPDSYYFARMFKRYTGIAPIRYRTERRKYNSRPNMSSMLAEYEIVPERSQPYSDYDNHYRKKLYKKERTVSMSYSNKSTWGVTLLLCLTLLLSACSTGAGNTANGGAQGNQIPAATNSTNGAEQPQTKIVSTVKGDVEVPVNPQRVVVLYLLGDVLSIGVKPIGVSDVIEGAAFENELSDIQSLGAWYEPNPEAVLALNPDVIIVPSEETYEALHQIAPTVYIPHEKMTIEERLQKIGEVFNKEGESKVLIDNFNAKVEQSKKKLAEAGILDKAVSIMEGGSADMYVIRHKNYGRGSQVIYDYLGMKLPEVAGKDNKDIQDGFIASFEVLADYTGDYIFRSSYEGMEDLTQNKLWNSIQAVKEGHLIEIDFGLSYYSDIYSLDKQLDYIVDSLLATKK
jgi:iron complex transport system substrate-binding protein